MSRLPIVSAEALRAAVSARDLIEPVAHAFVEYSAGRGAAPITVLHPTSHSDLHIKAAVLDGHDLVTVKAAGWSARLAETGEAASSGFIAVFSADTCRPIALLVDDHYLTDIRTAAAGAVAARVLARDEVDVVGVIGTGEQARLQVLAFAEVRRFRTVLVWGRRPERAAALARQLETGCHSVRTTVVESIEEIVARADVVITATASRRPLLRGGWLRPGQHVTAVGADDTTKAELDAVAFRRADRVIVDSRESARRYGDLFRAIEREECSLQDIDGELGEVLAGRIDGRRGQEEITIAKLVGLGVQDLVAADTALRRLGALAT